MQHIFISQSGKTFAPDFFTVYYKADGKTFKRLEEELNMHRFYENKDLEKIELYQNGTGMGDPVLKNTIYREDYSPVVIVQYSTNIGKAV